MKQRDVSAALFLFSFVLLSSVFALPAPAFSQSVRVPQTGQTLCYDTAGQVIACEGTGQDGEVLAGVVWPSPRFVSGTGAESTCVTDGLTGLMWLKDGNLPNAKMTWNDAIDYSNGLTACGYSDWRLPNINELGSIINVGVRDIAAWLTTNGFTNLQTDYWSSTTAHLGSPFDCNAAWVMTTGGSPYMTCQNDQDPGQQYWVLPIRGQSASVPRTGLVLSVRTGDDGNLRAGVSWPVPRFVDNGNSTITDNLTGLMWTKSASPFHSDSYIALRCGSLGPSWQSALDAVKCLNRYSYAGYSDWRLPNRSEILSHFDYSKTAPALPDGHPFIDVGTGGSFWSSTTVSDLPDDAWVVEAGGGSAGIDVKNTDLDYDGVWPVRGGAVSTLLTLTNPGSGSGTVTSSPAGVSCGSTCSASFIAGTSLTLTAVPSSGSCFIGWGAPCNGYGTCSLTIGSNISLTATFQPTGSRFCDVSPGGWAENYINALLTHNVTTGCTSGSDISTRRYCPSDYVTRAQMAAFIIRAKEGEPSSDYCASGSPFTDVDQNDWSCKYIKRLKELNLTTGYGGSADIYAPNLTISREQMAAFIIRAVEGEPVDLCTTGSEFTDVGAASWSCKYIKRLKQLNLTTGYGGNPDTYAPTLLVQRDQMAAFLGRAFFRMP